MKGESLTNLWELMPSHLTRFKSFLAKEKKSQKLSTFFSGFWIHSSASQPFSKRLSDAATSCRVAKPIYKQLITEERVDRITTSRSQGLLSPSLLSPMLLTCSFVWFSQFWVLEFQSKRYLRTDEWDSVQNLSIMVQVQFQRFFPEWWNLLKESDCFRECL